MAKIKLSEAQGPYGCSIDTDVMQVEIRDCFLGVCFVTEDGEGLAVSMRDTGFELHYFSDDGAQGWTKKLDLKNGNIEEKNK